MSSNSEAVKACRRNKKDLILKSMGSCCAICNFDVPEALVIHHIIPKDKTLSFGNIRANNINWTAVVAELRKCILLCANCHNIIHAKGLENYNFTSSFNEEYAFSQRIPKAHLVDTIFIRKCTICGTVLKHTQVSCCSESCRVIHNKNTRQKVNWDTELPNIYRLRNIDKLTYKAIGKIYSVSDRTISDWLKKYTPENAILGSQPPEP